MIIFDLDCLANDEHRRHFIDVKKRECACGSRLDHICYKCKYWQPDHKAYNEACGEDETVKAVGSVYEMTAYAPFSRDSQIWSSRCESTREKTLDWIISNLYWDSANRDYLTDQLKLRPIGDTSPKEELFKRWLGEWFENTSNQVDFAFSSHKPTIDMFRRRGIFVFDCNQEI